MDFLVLNVHAESLVKGLEMVGKKASFHYRHNDDCLELTSKAMNLELQIKLKTLALKDIESFPFGDGNIVAKVVVSSDVLKNVMKELPTSDYITLELSSEDPQFQISTRNPSGKSKIVFFKSVEALESISCEEDLSMRFIVFEL